jgi:DNA-directed RNA polymerase III subunit RPC3
VQNLFLFGHTKVSGLEGAYDAKSKKHVNGHDEMDVTNGANGHGETSIIPNGQLHAILIRLLEAGVIQPVVKSMFRSPTDTYNAIEREVLRDEYGGNTKGAKQKEDLKLKIQSRLRDLRSEGDWDGNNKRRRLSIGVESVHGDNHYEDNGFRLDVGFQSLVKQEESVC